MNTKRSDKLAEMARIAYGLQWGMGAFDDRLDEMGPGPAARGNGRGGKGGHSDPTSRQVVDGKRPIVVSSKLERLIDDAYQAVLDLEAAYRPIAQPVNGLPTAGAGNCAWCEDAARAWRNAAAKAGGDHAAASDVSVHRCRPYLWAKLADDKRALVCRSCYRFNLRESRPPTTEELWSHAQGGQMLLLPRKAKRAAMKAATRS